MDFDQNKREIIAISRIQWQIIRILWPKVKKHTKNWLENALILRDTTEIYSHIIKTYMKHYVIYFSLK